MGKYLDIKKRQDDKAKEIWTGVAPPASQCKKCVHAYKNVKISKDAVIYGATNSSCDMYEPPDSKPNGILEDKADCEFYEEE